MKLSNFKFKLPEELIAQEADPFRDGCRMLVLHRKTGKMEHKMFNDLLSYFDEAYAAIEKYKGDEATYNTLRRHINVEWLYPALVAINNFEDSFAAVDYNAMKAKFKTICSEEGMVCSGERIDISSILKDM